MSGNRAKLFWNGRSQAVRLPKEFRFRGEEVQIRKEGDAVILEPVKRPPLGADHWARIDELGKGLDWDEIEPMSVELLDVNLDDEDDE
jgi:virulence-associated protein VagC